MLATEEEKNIIEDIADKIIQEDSKDNETCYLCEDDKTDTETNQLDFWGYDIEPDFLDYGYGECGVTYNGGEYTLSPIDETSIQVLDSAIEGMYSDRKEMRQMIKNVSNSLKVQSIDIKRKSVFSHSIIYDIKANVYFICDMKKPFMDIRIISKENIMDIISIFQQRTDFSYAPIHLEINEECFMFGGESKQKLMQ